MNENGWKEIWNKYDNTCSNCQKLIPAGERIEWRKDTGIRHMHGCKKQEGGFKKQFKNAYPTTRCGSCKKLIPVGDLIWWSGAGKKVRCEKCG